MMNINNINTNDMFMQFGSMMATIMFVRALYSQYLPPQWRDAIRSFFMRYTERIARFFSPYLHVTFEEYTGERFNRSKMYSTIETYLSEKTSTKARSLKANFVKDGNALAFGLGDNEEVTDEFEGVKVWWNSRKLTSRSQTITVFPGSEDKRHYRLTFHGRHRKVITESYVQHVLDEGKAIEVRKRQRKLFTNIKEDGGRSYYSKWTLWTHVEFKHPATFDTLAMEKSKKQGIIDDLVRFTMSKDYYAKVGKPWKRGYLLYGPPGTGKSTMIAAMANLLEYDIYDLELTSVKDNTQLRRLLIETSSKSIIVIEDIDCSLDLTGQRSSKEEEKKEESEDKDDAKEVLKKKLKEARDTKKSEVTLSGLLNFIDGIWSACGEERLIIFTTNHIEKLDPALIRRGRMDMHIELSYCCYEAFKLLAKNYLDVEDQSHPLLFGKIKVLLEETKMTPADVAENLMPKSLCLDVEESLECLINALEKAKEDEKLKAQEEEREREKERFKKEKEEKEKEEKEEKVNKEVKVDEAEKKEEEKGE